MTDRVKKKHVMNELLRTYARSNLGEATFSFALDGKGRLLVHMKEEEKLLRVAEIETVQRMEILPWMAAWPMLVDPSVLSTSTCCCCILLSLYVAVLVCYGVELYLIILCYDDVCGCLLYYHLNNNRI